MVEAAPAETQGFSLAKLTELAGKCSADAEAVPTDEFCALLEMIVNLL